jgi:subtilisin family serine protease
VSHDPEIQDAPPAWVRGELGGATGRGIRVAVVDSGWDRTIADDRVLPGVGFVDPEDDFATARNDDDQDVLGHGTACAGVILGVAPDARIIPVKVFGKVLETSPGTLRAALLWAQEAGVQVINVSLGTRLEGQLHPLYHACEMARRAGIIIVAAGHNANDWSYPAIFENVIGVSAARFDSPYHFRYRPDEAMECEAWGVERPVLWVGGQRVVRHGTSFAAPNVAGIVAMILERHPGATLEQVRDMLSRFALPSEAAAAPKKRAPRRTAKAAQPAGTAAKTVGTKAKKAASGEPKTRKAAARTPASAGATAKKTASEASKTGKAAATTPASARSTAKKAPAEPGPRKAVAERAAAKTTASAGSKPRTSAKADAAAPAPRTPKKPASAGARAKAPASDKVKPVQAAPVVTPAAEETPRTRDRKPRRARVLARSE